jgi:hypothetical protein
MPQRPCGHLDPRGDVWLRMSGQPRVELAKLHQLLGADEAPRGQRNVHRISSEQAPVIASVLSIY